MKKILTSIFTLLLITACVKNQKLDHLNNQQESTELKMRLDGYLNKVKQEHNIPAMALAVIQDGEILYQSYSGMTSLEVNEKVNENTLFRIFSATKLVTAVAVFQLIERGQLDLMDPAVKYLDHLPKKWSHIKIKNLLTHSSGLPDLIKYKSDLTDSELLKKLYEEPIEFDLGSQFRYNQTNYWLLAQIIEKITSKSFDKYVIKNQFDTGSDGVLFSSDSNQKILNRATRYHFNPKNQIHEKDTNNSGKRGHSGNGLNISLHQFIEWNRKLDENLLINNLSKKQMWSAFEFTNSNDDFLYGWGRYWVNGIESTGFTGGNLAGFRKFIDDDTTIIFLSNGYQNPAYDIIMNDVARMAVDRLRAQELTLEEEVMSLVVEGNLDQASESYIQLKSQNPGTDFSNLKWNINGIGNKLQFIEKDKNAALKVFDLNSRVNPDWWVAMASLAEIQEEQQDYKSALESYLKAILLNKKNEWDYNAQMNQKVNLLKEKTND